MSRIRIYYETVSLSDTEIIDKDITHKLKDVLRLGSGAEVFVFNGQGKEYVFTVQNISKKSVRLHEAKLVREDKEPLKKTILAFPVIQEERVDFILQKATELGIWEFWPFYCQRSLSIEISKKKYQRWQKVTIEATRQSGRLWLPQVSPVKDFKELIGASVSPRLVGAIGAEPIKNISLPAATTALFAVGPIGDFTDSEYHAFKENGFHFIKLADNLLRTETAAIYGAGVLENML